MRTSHLLVGVLGVLVFLATGLYMRANFPALYAGNETLRYMYRANHVYLLLASLVNIALGVYLVVPGTGWKARLSRVGSGLVLLAPFVLCYAFFVEVPKASPERIFTALGVVLVALGVVLHLPCYRMPRAE